VERKAFILFRENTFVSGSLIVPVLFFVKVWISSLKDVEKNNWKRNSFESKHQLHIENKR